MVKDILIVLAIIEDSRLIIIPGICINSDNNWSGGECVGKIVAACNIAIAWYEEMTIYFIADASCTFVRVFLFIQAAVFGNIVDGKSHLSSNTASVSEIAINKLLFREAFKLSVEDFAGGLKACNSGEGPTWSTLSLIFDRADCTLSPPVDVGIGYICCIELNKRLGLNWLRHIGEIGLSKLLLSESRELIEAFFIGCGLVEVVGFNEGFFEKEDFFSVEVFNLRRVIDVELEFPLLVFWKLFLWRVLEQDSCGSDKECEY